MAHNTTDGPRGNTQDQLILERFRETIVHRFPRSIFAGADITFLPTYQELNEIVLKIEGDYLGLKAMGTETHIIQTPASWFQMLKRDYFPAWFLKRWPVRYFRRSITCTLKKQVIFPDLDAWKLGRPAYREVYDWGPASENINDQF